MPNSMKNIDFYEGSFYGGTNLKNLNLTMKKGAQISFIVTLGEGSNLYRPTITYKNKKKIAKKGNILKKQVITAKTKGKAKIVFECIGDKNKKIKTVVTITIK